MLPPQATLIMLSQSYLNIVSIIVIAAITTATIAIQFAHRTSLRLTSESHLPRARCRRSLLALRNINVTRSVNPHSLYGKKRRFGSRNSHKICEAPKRARRATILGVGGRHFKQNR